MDETYLLQTKGLTKVYGEQTAVRAVNLHLRAGRLYGLLGRNGAGKTTIMKMALRLVLPTEGEIRLFGQRLTKRDPAVFHRIGAMIETPGFYPNLTGTENLAIFARLRGTTRPDAIAHALSVVGLPYHDKKLFSQYSLGMKQRLGIANAILHDPELLILDEPSNGLDPIGIAEMRALLRRLCEQEGKTILLSSHILSEVDQLADDIGILDHGVLLEEDTMDALRLKNRHYISLTVSDTASTARILEQRFHLSPDEYAVQDEAEVRVYATGLDSAGLNRSLVAAGVSVADLHLCRFSLEEYFQHITGGEGIG